MDYNTIARLYKVAPTIQALRKDWIPLAISFLYYAFKRKHEVLLPQEIFREQLDTYIEHINTTLPEEMRFSHQADYYMDRWSREDDLIRVRSRDDGYVVQLSPHAERIIGWFEDIQSRGVIGTESRLRNILFLLEEVITHSTDDVEERLRQLYEQRDQIEAKIARIEETQQVDDELSDVQIRERLAHISGMANQLLRDFGLVEEHFRDIARAIQQAQLDPEARRGEILESALDAGEKLESSDEGQSFRAFYELLTHHQEREKFDVLIAAVFEAPRLAAFSDENNILQRLTSHLLDAGERVNQSNRRLTEHLRRVVDTRNVTESRRVQELAGEIKHISSQFGDEIIPMFNARTIFYEIEGDPEVDLPLERPLFDPPEQIEEAEPPQLAPARIDPEALRTLYETFFVDNQMLLERIARLLMSRSEATLAELVNSYPINKGMSEVIAYMLIAAHEPQHEIDHTAYETITIHTPHHTNETVTIPRTVFRRDLPQSERNHA
jgi:hypothetical protein